MQNQPGAGAATFRKLAGGGVNADLLVPVRVSDDLFFAVICVDDLDKARRARRAGDQPGRLRDVSLAIGRAAVAAALHSGRRLNHVT